MNNDLSGSYKSGIGPIFSKINGKCFPFFYSKPNMLGTPSSIFER